MSSRHEAGCKLCVNGTGCWKDVRDGREYALHELSIKGRSNRKAFWVQEVVYVVFER